MTQAVIAPETRAQLLVALRSGQRRDTALEDVGLQLADVEADPELWQQCRAAYALGEARANDRLVTMGLKNSNPHMILRWLEQRPSPEQEFPEATAGQDGGPDLSKLSDVELRCIQALLSGDVEEFRRQVHQIAVDLATKMERRRRARDKAKEEKAITRRKVDEPATTVAPNVVPMAARRSMSSPMIRG